MNAVQNRPDWSLWISAAALAIAAHAGAFNAIMDLVPAPVPPPVETQIVVDTIQMASSSAILAPRADAPDAPESLSADAPGTVETLSADVTRTPESASVVAPPDAAETAAPDALQPQSLAAPATPASRTGSAERVTGQAVATTGTENPTPALPAPAQPQAVAQTSTVAPSAVAAPALTTATQTQRITGQPVQAEPPAAAAPARVAAAPVVAQSVARQPSLSAAPAQTPEPVPVATAVEQGSIAEAGVEVGAISGAQIASVPPPSPALDSVVAATPQRDSVAEVPQPPSAAPAPEAIATAPAVTPLTQVARAPEVSPTVQEPLPRSAAEQAQDASAKTPDAPPASEAIATAPLAAPRAEVAPASEVSPALLEALARIAAEQAQEASATDAPDAPPAPEALALVAPPVSTLTPQRLTPRTLAPVADPPAPAPSGDGLDSAAPAPTGDVSAKDRARYAGILEFLKTYEGGACFAALPALGEETGNLSLDAFGETSKRLDGFRSGLEASTGVLPNTYLKPVSAAQCATLAFIKQVKRYPAFGVYFQLPERVIPSGSQLEGQIFNTGGLVIHLLLIDDEGIVQSLDSFVKFRRAAAEFSIPMTFQGGPIVTQQLLMAVGSPGRLETVRDLNGQPAEAFFAALQAEQERKGLSLDLSMVAFSVQ